MPKAAKKTAPKSNAKKASLPVNEPEEEIVEEIESEEMDPGFVEDEVLSEEELDEELAEEESSEEDSESEESEEESGEVEYEVIEQQEREIIYPEIECRVYDKDNALTFEVAKQLLGWTEPSEGKEFQDPHVYMFDQGIYLAGVEGVQRSIMPTLFERYSTEILRRNWSGLNLEKEDQTPNGESIIIGKTGRTLDGMHRLLGLIRAVERFRENPEEFSQWWDSEEEIHLPTIVITGISEDIDIVNTINTGKDRKLADAIHASGLFKDFNKRDTKLVCKAADFAIKTIWDHVGVYHAYGPRKSHAEAFDFLQRHPRIIEAVKHCFAFHKELAEKGITTGAMAALMYLMGASKTKPSNAKKTGYYDVDEPSEKQIDFGHWKKAEEFVDKFGNETREFTPLYGQIRKLTEAEDGKAFGIFRTVDRNVLYEKTCLIFKAWSCYLSGNPITAKAIGLKYKIDEEGEKYLDEEVILAGIDRGIFRKDEEGTEEDE